MNCWFCENQSVCEVHDLELVKEMEKQMTIDNLFDVGVDNVHMVQVDSYEADAPIMPTSLAPTPKQFAFLKKLFAERSQNEEAQILRAHLLSELKAGKLSRNMASEAIGDILLMEKDKPGSKTQQIELPDIQHGQVWVNDDGKFIKVCLNQQQTSFYGKFWDSSKLEWIYGPGLLKDLNHRCTADEAKEFSLQWESEHRYCIFCMRHLSDPRSEFAGYGETCAEHHNLPWGAVDPKSENPAPNGYCRLCNKSRPFGNDPKAWGCNC